MVCEPFAKLAIAQVAVAVLPSVATVTVCEEQAATAVPSSVKATPLLKVTFFPTGVSDAVKVTESPTKDAPLGSEVLVVSLEETVMLVAAWAMASV
jgi:hypothetical protein